MSNKEIDDNSEYKFDNSEDSGYVSTPGASDLLEDQDGDITNQKLFSLMPKIDLKKINWRRIIAPLAILAAILTLYGVSTFLSSERGSLSEQTKINMQNSAAKIQNHVSDKINKIAPSKRSLPTSSYDNTLLDSKNLQASQSDSEKNQELVQKQINNIKEHFNDYRDRLSVVNDQQQQIQQDINAIANQVEQLTTALQHVLIEQQKIKKAIKPKPKNKVKPMPEAYHVRAIVPGRVWLESETGENVSLRVGSKLAGYGEVKVISPRQGMVIMSNGSIIQYAVDDI